MPAHSTRSSLHCSAAALATSDALLLLLLLHDKRTVLFFPPAAAEAAAAAELLLPSDCAVDVTSAAERLMAGHTPACKGAVASTGSVLARTACIFTWLEF
jgi:hypothetical protein